MSEGAPVNDSARNDSYNARRRNLLGRYLPLVDEDLRATYSRDLHKWLVVAPIIGIVTGLAIAGLVIVILRTVWPRLFALYLAHPWAMIPGIALTFLIAGVIMQIFAPDPNEHSTEEIIRSYHEHEGQLDFRSAIPKLAAAVATVGTGGSAALEGPAIYTGGVIGSWLWAHLKRLRLTQRDRRILLITGAAAGMGAVFRAPLTGIVFALEMPYKDDLAHEALLPSLIASVISYMTMASILGAEPLFNFASVGTYSRHDLFLSALLGIFIGLIAMTFSITFRRLRGYVVRWKAPHWLKLTIGGALTGSCGLAFVKMFNDGLVPLGPNYEAVGIILGQRHTVTELLVFAVLKLMATLCTLSSGGVSAMFVPLFLSGGTFGTAFAQILHQPVVELYAAVGMASFIAAAYKTPLAAVVFVAEATGGHAFLIPSLIGAAVAYAVSGDASVSGDQHVSELESHMEFREKCEHID